MDIKQIKVLHIDTEKSWRGGQQQAVYLYQEMLTRGYSCSFVCTPSSELEKYFSEKAIPHKVLRFIGEFDLIAAYKLGAYANRNNYNILHLHSGHALAWGLWAKLFFPSLILVASRRVDFSIKKNPFSQLKYKTGSLNKIIAISDNIRNVLVKDGVKESKISVIHSGIDLDKFSIHSRDRSFLKKWNIPENATVVGTVAALTGHKDYPNLVNAAKIVCDSVPNVYFLAVGSGKLLEEMTHKAASLGLEKKFIFTGFQKNIGAFLLNFDIFVLASKLEGLGTSVLDALAAGLPVVATNAGGIPEMINNEKNGLLAPSQNSTALAEAILRLIKDNELRNKLKLKAKQSISHYSYKITADKNIKLYEELVIKKQNI